MNYAPEIRLKRYPIKDYICTLNACEKMFKNYCRNYSQYVLLSVKQRPECALLWT